MTPRPSRLALFSFAALALGAAAAPSVTASPEGDALAAQVEIRRTAYGVPHILAPDEKAAAFGFAYAQAEDHLPNIMRSLLRARGESARYLGGRANLENDFESLQFRVHNRAEETYHRLDPEFRAVLEGFAAGLNHYIERHRAALPEWITASGPVTPHDAAAHGNAGVMRFAFDRGGIIKAFLRKQGKAAAANEINAPRETETGSNMFALTPDRTAGGKAILVGNPHQPWSEVATYYEAQVTVPGKIDFYGSTFVGRPILTSGFSRELGWSHTVNYPDLEEIYELDADPARPDHYLFDGGSVAIRSETFTVQWLDGGEMKSETRTFHHTPLGPVIHRTADKVYILRSACMESYAAYEQWWRMSKARNFDEFQKALGMMQVPMFNIAYADREGRIYYIWNGMVPRLPHPAHGAEAVPARTSADIWTQFHTLSELPALLNPKGGYVHNANDPPFLTNLNEPLDTANYPPYFGVDRIGLRTQHGLKLIHNDRKFTLEEAWDAKFSPGMLLALRVKDDLLAAVAASSPGEDLAAAAALLKQWDGTVSAGARGAVLFDAWWRRHGMTGGMNRMEAFATPWSADHPIETPRGLSDPAKAVEDLKVAIEETKRDFGSIDAAWGEVHRVRKGTADFPASGGSGFMGCYRVLDFTKDPDGKRRITGGDSWIFAVEFTDPPRALTVVGYSQSGDPASSHYSDQTELYAHHQSKKAAFTEEQIRAALIRSYHPGEEKAGL